MLINTILNEIDSACNESEDAVMESLFESYDKALMILEYCESDDVSGFSIFQEAKVEDGDDAGKKENVKKGILSSITGIISKLIQRIKSSFSAKFEAKRMKNLEKKAKKLGVDVSKLSDSEKELLAASINGRLTEKDINKIITKRKLKSFGLKAGLGAIVIGGSAYYINNKKELVIEKVNEYKGKVYKTLDEKVFKGVREATDAAVEKISNVADAAAEKIKATADAVRKAVETVINFLKKLFEAFKRFFNIHILRYDKTEVEKVMCKIDPNTGSLHVTFDLTYIEEWIKETKTFISNATQFIGHKVSNGNLEKNVNEEGKSTRGGAIAAVQKEHDSATIIKGKNGATLVADYRNHLEKISNKFNSKVEYQPVDAFVNMASRLAPELNSVCDLAKKLNDKYIAMINNPNRKQTDYLNAEKEVATTLRGILDTQILITESVDAINNYINTVAEMTAALEIGSEAGSSTPAPAAEEKTEEKPAEPDTKS
jgi:hypothetical protein